MEEKMEIKKMLLANCKKLVEDKYKNVTKIIASNRKALESETKSSAGDKHETGRAMLQLEIEKASQQFVAISAMQEVLLKIEISKKNEIGKLGSLIYTSLGVYFLAISIGKITIIGKDYFAVSPSSPIGYLLLGKRVGDVVIFSGKKIEVLEIL